MKRREFITLLGSTAATSVAWPLAARAQQAAKLPTIGFLGQSTPLVESQRLAAFLKRLHELGWIEGRTVAIEYAWGELFLRFPPDGRRIRVLHFEPIGRAPGAVGGILALRDNAFEAELAGVPKDSRTVAFHMLV